jgi:small multidrug resistance family-3 protein
MGRAAVIDMAKTLGLFIATALFEIVGCYLPLQWMSGKGSAWLLIPAVLSLAAFVWLLSLHPTASGRVYATYGGVYVATAMVWLWLTDGVRPQLTDFLGAALTLMGAAIIAFGYRSA